MKKLLSNLTLMLLVFISVSSIAQTIGSCKDDASLLSEDFEGNWPPTGWSLINLEGANGFIQDGTDNKCALHAFKAGTQDNWMISPALDLSSPGALSVRCKNMFSGMWYQHHGIYISTTGTNPEDFTLLQEYSTGDGEWQTLEIDLAAYSGNTVYIGFNYKGDNADNWYIDDVVVNQSSSIDIEMRSLTTRGFVLANKEATLIAEVANMCSQDMNGTIVTISGEGVDLSKTIDIPAAGIVEVEFTYTTTSGEQVLTATASNDLDEVPENNTFDLNIRPVEKPVYGFTNGPGNMTYIVMDKEDYSYCYKYSEESTDVESRGMAFIGEVLYVATSEYKEVEYSGGTKYALIGYDFGTMDFETGTFSAIKSVDIAIEHMAYNPVDDMLYAVGFDNNDVEANWRTRNLYKINVENGEYEKVATPEGWISPKIGTFAIDNNGNAYGIDISLDINNGTMHVINLENFNYSIGSPTNLSPMGSQSMYYDFDLNKMVWNYVRNSSTGFTSQLYDLNVSDGGCTLICEGFPGYVCGLTSPFEYVPQPSLGLKEGFNAWPLQDWTIINSGDQGGTVWSEFDETYFEGTKCAIHKSDDDPNGENSIDYMISPKIRVPERGKLVFFEYNASMDYYGKHEVLISTGSANPDDNDFVLLEEYSKDVKDWTERLIDLEDYIGEDIYIAFKHTGDYGSIWAIDAFEIYEEAPKELRITRLNTPPGVVGENTEVVINPILSNRGYEDITDAIATLTIDDITYTKTVSIPAHDDYCLAFDAWTASSQGVHTATLTVEVEGDENTYNNTAAAAFYVIEGTSSESIGYAIFSGDNTLQKGPVRFNVFDPQNAQPLEHHNSSDEVPFAGCLIHNLYYCNFQKKDPNSGKPEATEWKLIDTETGETMYSGPADIYFTEMAYNYKTDILYGITNSGKDLYIINPTSNECTLVASKEAATTVAFAIDAEGTAYAITADGLFYGILLDTYDFVQLGQTNVVPNYYIQSMAYDAATDRLFWIADNSLVYVVEKSHGAATLINSFKGQAEIAGFDFFRPTSESKHYVNFNVTDQNFPIEGASVTLNGVTKTTNAEGNVVFIPYEVNESIIYNCEFENHSVGDAIKLDGDLTLDINMVGLEDFTSAGIQSYPNPTNGMVYLKNIGTADIEVVNTHGKTIKTVQSNSPDCSIDLSDFDNGVYFLRANTVDKTLNQKIILNK